MATLTSMRNSVKEFRAFVLRGNVVDLAIGVAIGAAFSDVISKITEGFLTPMVSLIPGPNLQDRLFTLGGQKFLWGSVVEALIKFLLMAIVLFFMVVKPINRLRNFFEGDDASTRKPAIRPCPECRSVIPADAARCAFCTQAIEPLEDKAAETTRRS